MVTTARHTSSIYKCKYLWGVVKMQRTKDTLSLFFLHTSGTKQSAHKSKTKHDGEKKKRQKITSHFGNIARARYDTMYRTAKTLQSWDKNKNNTADNDSKNHETKVGGNRGELPNAQIGTAHACFPFHMHLSPAKISGERPDWQTTFRNTSWMWYTRHKKIGFRWALLGRSFLTVRKLDSLFSFCATETKQITFDAGNSWR